MANQQDDRLSKFVDRDGFESDKTYVLDVLNEIKKSINSLNDMKMTLFGSNTISQVIDAVKLLNKETQNLQKSKIQSIDLQIKESKLSYERLRLLEAEMKAEERRQRVAERSKKASSSTVSAGTGAGSDAEDSLSSFKQLQADAKAAKDEYNSLFLDFKRGMGATQTEVDEARDKWKSLEKQLQDVGKANKAAFDPERTASKNQTISNIESQLGPLQRRLSIVKSEMTAIAKEPGGNQSTRFKSLSADAAELSGKIKILQSDLKKVSDQERERQAIASEQGKMEKAILKEIGGYQQAQTAMAAYRAELRALQAEGEELAIKGLTKQLSEDETKRLAEITTKAQEMSAAIAKIEGTMGKGAKSNYAYAQQLFSLQQVLRETPNIAFGWNIFLASLSNNIPILTDDIQRLAQRNRELAAAGQKTIPVWRQLFNALGSLTSVIGIGVAVITIFSDAIVDFFTNLFKSNEEIKKAWLNSKKYLEMQKQLLDVQKSLVDSQKKLNEIAGKSNDAAIRAIDAQIKRYEALGVSIDKVFNLKNKLNNLGKENAELRLDDLFISSRQNSIANLDTELDIEKKRLDEINKIYEQGMKSRSQILERLKNASSDSERSSAKRSLDLFDKYNTSKILQTENEISALKKSISEKETQRKQIELQGEIDKEKFLTAVKLENQAKIAKGESKLNELEIKLLDDFRKKEADPNYSGLSKSEIEKMKLRRDNYKAEIDIAQSKVNLIEDVEKENAEALAKIEEEKARQQKFWSDEARARILSNSKKSAEQQIADNQSILDNERSTEKQRIAAIDKIKEANINLAKAERDNVVKNIGATGSEIIAAENELSTKLKNIDIETAKQRREIQESYLSRRVSALRSIREQEAALTLKYDEEISTGIYASLEQRNKAMLDHFSKRKELLKKSIEDELKLAGLTQEETANFISGGDLSTVDGEVLDKKKTLEELKAMRVEYESAINDLQSQSAARYIQILVSELDRTKVLMDKSVSEISVTLENALNNIDSVSTNEVDAMKDLFTRGKIDSEEYTDSLYAIYKKSALDRIRVTTTALEDELALYVNSDQDRLDAKAEFERAVVNLEKATTSEQKVLAAQALSKADAYYKNAIERYRKMLELLGLIRAEQQKEKDEVITGIVKENEEQAEYWDRRYRLASQFADFIGNINEIVSNRRVELIDEELAALENRATREKQIIESSLQDEESKRRRLADLDIKTENQRAILEARRRKEERDKAIANKSASLLKIGVDTAQAIAAITFQAAILAANPVTKAAGLDIRALGQIPFVIAAAALQSAAIAAQPLPKLKMGTKDFRGGFAELGDGGKSELVIQPDGSMFMTADTPEVHYLPKHTVVLPDAKKAISGMMGVTRGTTDSIISLSGNQIDDVYGIDILDSTMKSGFESLASVIKNKPEIVLRRGMNKDLLIRYGMDYYKYIN